MRAFDVSLVVCFLVEAFRVLPAGGGGGTGGIFLCFFPLVFSFTDFTVDLTGGYINVLNVFHNPVINIHER